MARRHRRVGLLRHSSVPAPTPAAVPRSSSARVWVVLGVLSVAAVALVGTWGSLAVRAATQPPAHAQHAGPSQLAEPQHHAAAATAHARVGTTAGPAPAGAVAAAAGAVGATADADTRAAEQVHMQVTATHLEEGMLYKADAAAARAGAEPSTPSPTAAAAAAVAAAAAAAAARPVPKVALLFMTRNTIANEGVWRAFFEAAARLQLQPAVAAAAAAAASQAPRDADSLAAVVASGPSATRMHSDVGRYPEYVYPGYRVQHGITAGADPPPRRPAAAGGTRPHAGPACCAAHAPAAFPDAADAWEAGLLQADMQRLTAQGHAQGRARAGPAPLRQQTAPAAAAWSVHRQLSTMSEALTAAGLPLPAAVLSATAAGGGQASRAPAAAAAAAAAARPQQVDRRRCTASLGLAAQQPLFSVYVHTPVGQLLPRTSLFSGCELRVRVNSTRGYAQHVLAEAEALLLWAALADAHNARFALVSDSSIPLHAPHVIWAQLMHEQRSRLDACVTPRRDTQRASRWRGLMATAQFGPQHWRKSSQWFALTRPHALLAVADVHVREMLHRYCYTNFTRGFPSCVSDEHWLPSLLASYGLDNQTDCEGQTHFADWSAGGWHPRAFQPADLTRQLVAHMRAGIPHQTAALAAAAAAAAASGSRSGHLHALADSGSAHVAGGNASQAALLQQQRLARAARHNAMVDRAVAAVAAAAAACRPADVLESASHTLASHVTAQAVPHPASPGGSNSSLQAALQAAGYVPLGSRCPLFARKFPAGAEAQTLALALSCAGVGLGSWCQRQLRASSST